MFVGGGSYPFAEIQSAHSTAPADLAVITLVQGAEAKYGIIFTTFFEVWWVRFVKKRDKYKFSWLALVFKQFLIKIQPNMSKQEKKRQRIYDFLDAETNY